MCHHYDIVLTDRIENAVQLTILSTHVIAEVTRRVMAEIIVFVVISDMAFITHNRRTSKCGGIAITVTRLDRIDGNEGEFLTRTVFNRGNPIHSALNAINNAILLLKRADYSPHAVAPVRDAYPYCLVSELDDVRVNRFTSPRITIQLQDIVVPAGGDALDLDEDLEKALTRMISTGGVHVLSYAGRHGLGGVHLTVDTRRRVLVHTDPRYSELMHFQDADGLRHWLASRDLDIDDGTLWSIYRITCVHQSDL